MMHKIWTVVLSCCLCAAVSWDGCPGEFRISRFDLTQRIIAGTFWFDAAFEGDTIRVRDGRFDTRLY